MSLALAVIMALHGCSLLSLPFLKTPMGYLPRLGGVLLVTHALPRVVTPAIHNSLGWEAWLPTLSGLESRLEHNYLRDSLYPTKSLILWWPCAPCQIADLPRWNRGEKFILTQTLSLRGRGFCSKWCGVLWLKMRVILSACPIYTREGYGVTVSEVLSERW